MSRSETALPRRVLREPLVHFLVLGAALFALFAIFGGETAAPDTRIVVSTTQIERLAGLFERQWRRPPTVEELDGLIQSHVREEVLFREAVAMGLERDDTVIRRRLAQKIEFLSQDLAAQVELSEEDLRAFYDEHPDLFRIPALISFDHVYVNRDRRGAAAADDAVEILEQLRDGADRREAGDRFMLQSTYLKRDASEVARHFGSAFAEQVFTLAVGSWEGPVASGYGLHLVRVNALEESYLPEFPDVRAEVADEATSFARRQTEEQFYTALRDRYEVVIEGAS